MGNQAGKGQPITPWQSRIVGYGEEPPESLLANPLNAFKIHPRAQRQAIAGALTELGWLAPVVVNRLTAHVLDGHARIEEAISRGEPTVPIVYVELDPAAEALALATFDPLGAMVAYDKAELETLLRDVTTTDEALMAMLGQLAEQNGIGADAPKPTARPSLSDQFVVPPFSVLDARQGYWQERKRAWLAYGIQSELGRGDNALDGGHSDQSINIDFYAQKRALEAELGRAMTTDEARNILVERGQIRHVDRSKQGGLVAQQGAGSVDAAGSKWAGYRGPKRAANATPGGSPRDAASLGPDGRTVRGDGRGRASGLARSSGQDLMRGEHVVGDSRKAADHRSNVNGSSPLPTGATETGTANMATGTSIFDPVLCELVYRWFSPPDGAVLDPFAGGSVRGIVAALLGRRYVGLDLRPEQVAANEQQAATITPTNLPRWIVGDSRDIGALAPGAYDIVFSCPPYADLERYSDDPRDLSTLEYPAFLAAYRQIVAASVGLLKPDRFACFVVGDVRAPDGRYRNFVSDTIAAFQDAGASLYNEAILVTAVGSLPIRVGKQFTSGRKLGKTHQNVLVFVKGDWRRAVGACGPVEIVLPEVADE